MKIELNTLLEVKKWLFSLEDMVLLFPRKSMIFKDKIFDTSFDLLKHLMESQLEKDKIKYCLIDVSLLNTYIEYAYQKKYLSKKQESKCSFQLNTILKMLYGLKKYYEV